MTTKDYVLIADCIFNGFREAITYSPEHPLHTIEATNLITGKLIISLRANNSRFNDKKFVDYINKRIGREVITL